MRDSYEKKQKKTIIPSWNDESPLIEHVNHILGDMLLDSVGDICQRCFFNGTDNSRETVYGDS